MAYVLYWLAFTPKHGLSLAEPIKWLTYPLVYIAYSLVRGSVVAWYPYWFVDVTRLGYPQALTNTGFVLVAFVLAGYTYLLIAKPLSRTAIGRST